MSTATIVLSWVLGGACILLGALTCEGWLRQRDRTRALLALSIALLCGSGVAVAATLLTRDEAIGTSDLAVSLFLASGMAFFAFRASMMKLAVGFTAVACVAVLITVVIVCIARIPLEGAQTPAQRLVSLLVLVVWLGVRD